MLLKKNGRPLGAISGIYLLAAAIVTWPGGITTAAEYSGADAVLRQAATGAATKPKEDKPQPAAEWRADTKAFREKAASLGVDDAIKQWLALVDRFVQIEAKQTESAMRGRSAMPVQAQELILALPPPTAWPGLTTAIEARPLGEGAQQVRELGLRFLAHTLTGDVNKRRDDITELEKLASKAKENQGYFFAAIFDELGRTMMATMEDPNMVLQSLERQLADQREDRGWGSLSVPNLVVLLDEKKAEDFLRRALLKSKVSLEIEPNTATHKLAQKLALEMVKELKVPQWGLVNSLDAVELFEALDKRFNQEKEKDKEPAPTLPGLPKIMQPDREDQQQQPARIYYLLGLIARNRTAEAIATAKKLGDDSQFNLPFDAIKQLGNAGFARQVNDFFHDLLAANPELPFWDDYLRLASQAGQTAEMLKLVRGAMAAPELSKERRMELQQFLHRALLADDQVDEGVAELRRVMRAKEPTVARRRRSSASEPWELAMQLARLGQLMNRPEWVEEGLKAMRETLAQTDGEEGDSWGPPHEVSLASFLIELNRRVEAEAVLAGALGRAVQAKPASNRSNSRDSKASTILAALVRLYHDAGKPAEVMSLFDNAPYWNAKDLVGLTANSGQGFDADDMSAFGHHGKTTTPFLFYAASALAKTGHQAEARKLLQMLLEQNPGTDRLYELLLELEGDTAPATLDALFARDRFEERPLIWKAHWLRSRKQLEVAKKTARQAIAIDPSDGEQGTGDRLRAYAVLAEIRAERGDQKEAEILRGAVRAIREAEQADQFLNAGLLKRAVKMYQDSLRHFADAYCIQSRLAVQLSELGLHDEAAEHYRRAYELMPGSFGRVESHCFGCERAFAGEQAQGIAEKVFSELAVKTPEKPQVHYLLGYLRDAQERHLEALGHYRTAVKLDADYLNAWLKIAELSRHVVMPAAERDAVAFSALRLDPLARHSSPSLELVSDLGALWRVVETNAIKPAVTLTNLYPLAASKVEFEKRQKSPREEMEFNPDYQEFFNSRSNRQSRSPAGAVAENGFIRAAVRLIGRESGYFD